eukprot:7543619-Heterocapsa_arctica.AAC.1
MGMQEEGGIKSRIHSRAVGSPGLRPEGFAGKMWRQMLEAEHTVALNTITDGGSATYFAEKTKSRIDYISVPQGTRDIT